jgi:hypothetical protein
MRISDVIINDRDVDRALREWVRAMSDIYDNRFGTVGGIVFDFRHELLAKTEWAMPKLGISFSVVRDDPDQPKIWFPWFGPAEIGSIWPTSPKSRFFPATGSADSNHNEELKTPPLRIETILGDGDRIIIDRVVSTTTDHILEHQHDSEVRCAYLLIQHQDGTATRPTIPITFRGRYALLDTKYPLNVLWEIEQRITDYFQEENSKIKTKLKGQNSYAERALFQLKEVRAMLGSSEFYNPIDFVDRALFLGYLWAKAETEVEVKPKAIARIKASKASSEAAKVVAAENSDKADKAWRTGAAECVKTIYQEDSSRTNAEIINLLSTRQSDNEKLPHGEKTLKEFVRSLRESGQIGPKIPKPKPARIRKIAKSRDW